MEIAKDAPGVTIEFGPHDKDAHVGVKKTGCQGVCELGPLVRIQKGDDVIQYTKVQIEDCQEIFEKSVQGNETISNIAFSRAWKPPLAMYSFRDSASNLPQFFKTIRVCFAINGISSGLRLTLPPF